MGRNITSLESNVLKSENKRKLAFDFFADAVLTGVTCESLAAVAGPYNDLAPIVVCLSALGVIAYYNDTLRRIKENNNLDNNYTEMYSEEKTLKLLKR